MTQPALLPDGRPGDLLDDTLSQMGQYADKMRAVAGPRRAVFMVLQGFAWEMLRDKDREPAMVWVKPELRSRIWRQSGSGCSADIPVCGFTGLSCPVFQRTGDWPPSRRSGALARRKGGKVARTRRLESLRHFSQ